MCFLNRSRDAECLGRACPTIANRFPCSLQEPFFKTIVQRGSDSARERDMAIKELQSYRLAHEGRKAPLAPPSTAPERTGLNDLALLTESQVEDSRKKTTLLFPNCLTLRRAVRKQVHSDIIPIIKICRRSAVSEVPCSAGESIYLWIRSGAPEHPARLCCNKPVNTTSSCSSSDLAPKGTELYNPPPLVTSRVHSRHLSPVVHTSSPTAQAGAAADFTQRHTTCLSQKNTSGTEALCLAL